MVSLLEESVLDFDLNFLQNSSSVVNDCKFDKQRKSVSITKRKIIATHSLICKYHAKNEKLGQTEVLLLAAKEECKQVCVDYKEALEKCTVLEKDNRVLKSRNKELEDSYVLSQNQCEAIKCHARQLEVLVREHESVIDSQKIESKLVKNNGRKTEKNVSAIQKENETLLSDLCLIKDIVLGKKKLKKRHKLLLKKYDSVKSPSGLDESSEESNDENDFFDSVLPSPCSEHEVNSENKKESVYISKEIDKEVKKVIADHESDCSNELISEDTGRGSSLAFSDGEKCYNSPDYFHNDNPFATDMNKIKEKKLFTTIGTSPLRDLDLVHRATSPVLFDDIDYVTHKTIVEIENGEPEEPELFISDIPLSNDIVTIKEIKKMVDIATSPVRDVEKVHISTSPILFEEQNLDSGLNLAESLQNAISYDNDCIIDNSTVDSCIIPTENSVDTREITHIQIEEVPSQCELEISGKSPINEQKKCLEKNNSNKLNIDKTNDSEIELILNSMRFYKKMISPIPKTPVKLNRKEHKNHQPTSLPLPAFTDIPRKHTVCPDALKFREENKTLHTSLADLSKEVMSIKCLLSQFLTPDMPRKCAYDSYRETQLDDRSQEAIVNNDLCSENNENLVSDEFTFEEANPPSETNVVQSSKIQNAENLKLIQKKPFMPEITSELNIPKVTSERNIVRTSDIEIETENNTCDDNAVPHDRINITYEDDEQLHDLHEKETLIPLEHDHDNAMKPALSKSVRKKNAKSIKLSRLDKFKRKLLPKSKIASIKEPIRKLRSKSKPISVSKPEPLIDTNALLNNKSAYEKAVEVMRELKLKEKSKKDKVNLIRKSDKVKIKNKLDKNENIDSNSKEHIIVNSITSPVNPVVCLSKLNLKKIKFRNSDDEQERKNYATRSRSKKSDQDSMVSKRIVNTEPSNGTEDIQEYELTPRKSLKRVASSDLCDVNCKRVLRSNSGRHIFHNKNTDEISNSDRSPDDRSDKQTYKPTRKRQSVDGKKDQSHRNSRNDKEINKSFEISKEPLSQYNQNDELDDTNHFDENVPPTNLPKESILCKMIEKYGKVKVKHWAKKVPDNISNSICKKLEDSIAHIIELPMDKTKPAMSKLVEDVQLNWNLKNFLSGLIMYLKDPARKRELFNKVSSPPAPPMTKSEQVLLYIIKQLQLWEPDIVNMVLNHIEFTLFRLNNTPEFDVIESMSHFHALVCQYFELKMRLRLFILDAMYCLSFKVVPLIKQCLDVWMHILPLAHMGIAKSPLVTCLVYLLHFYKCEDRFRRVQDIRYILNKKYFYKITDWSENKILEMFKTSIREVRDIAMEKKMLRISLIILAKRQGAKWCQKNIVKKLLMPLIEQEGVSLKIKYFCIAMLGPLVKPYPMDMKVHCEIVVNYLLDMLDQNPPDSLKEAIFTSLVYMNKHNQDRVTQALLSWWPKSISPEFEQLLQHFVQEKSLKVWNRILSRVTS